MSAWYTGGTCKNARRFSLLDDFSLARIKKLSSLDLCQVYHRPELHGHLRVDFGQVVAGLFGGAGRGYGGSAAHVRMAHFGQIGQGRRAGIGAGAADEERLVGAKCTYYVYIQVGYHVKCAPHRQRGGGSVEERRRHDAAWHAPVGRLHTARGPVMHGHGRPNPPQDDTPQKHEPQKLAT